MLANPVFRIFIKMKNIFSLILFFAAGILSGCVLHAQPLQAKIKRITSGTEMLKPRLEFVEFSVTIFDENGNPVEVDEKQKESSSHTFHLYNSRGQIIESWGSAKWTVYHDYGGEQETEFHQYYFYDTLGNFLSDSLYSSNTYYPYPFNPEIFKFNPWEIDEKGFNCESKYDRKGKKIKESCYENGGSLILTVDFRYNKKGYLEQDSTVQFTSDTIFLSMVRNYDEMGNIIQEMGHEIVMRKVNLKHNITYSYTYDHNGNWIRREENNILEGIFKVTKREIIYY